MTSSRKIQIPLETRHQRCLTAAKGDLSLTGQIPDREILFKTSRCSGPGGQNINKLNTKVTVFFDIPNSNILSDKQKQIILRKLTHRLTKDKRLIVTSQKFRTQNANRVFAARKLAEIIQKALEKPKPRRPTRPTASAVEKRIKYKKTRSLLKQQRMKIELKF